VEGRNLIGSVALADAKVERLPNLVAALLQANVDAIVTTSTPETQAAKSATSTIPVVMAAVIDSVETGLVPSLHRSGREHATG